MSRASADPLRHLTHRALVALVALVLAAVAAMCAGVLDATARAEAARAFSGATTSAPVIVPSTRPEAPGED